MFDVFCLPCFTLSLNFVFAFAAHTHTCTHIHTLPRTICCYGWSADSDWLPRIMYICMYFALLISSKFYRICGYFRVVYLSADTEHVCCCWFAFRFLIFFCRIYTVWSAISVSVAFAILHFKIFFQKQ